MATWTESDVTTLRAAVASGVLTVRYDGPPARMITYQSLAEMRSLLAEMQRDVSPRPRSRVARIRKGT